MSAGPNITKARNAWGDDIPEWVLVLAEICDQTQQKTVAEKIGYSHAVVSAILTNSYKGNLSSIKRAVEGAFLDLTIDCPVLGEVTGNVCMTWQRKPISGNNALVNRVWRACRGGCPHFYGATPSRNGRPPRGGAK